MSISYSLVGQADLLEKKGRKYTYKGVVYKCKELSTIYKDNQEAMDLYISGRSHKKAANLTAYIGLGFIGLGLGSGLAGSIAGGDIGLVGLILGVLSAGVGIVLEIVAITPRIVGNRKLKKARKTFNFEMIERHGYKSDTSLLFGVTKNGIGLVMQF